MTETLGNYISLLDFHYSIHFELESLTDEELNVWQHEQHRIAQIQASSINLLLERYVQTGSKVYIESAQSLQKTAETHDAMARLFIPYKATKEVSISPGYHVLFSLQ